MTTINDGGQAFPPSIAITPAGDVFYGEGGMTLRDWLAGMALTAMSADIQRNGEYGATMRALAGKAYVIADAMLASRSLKQEGN